jgi:prepilin-type N-terminal cleavage/methylation domain-containing protein
MMYPLVGMPCLPALRFLLPSPACGRNELVPRHLPHPRHAGFTLIELAIVVAVVSIMVGAAVPAFGRTLADARLQSVAAEMVQQLRRVQEAAIIDQQDLNVYFCTSPGASRTVYYVELFQKRPLAFPLPGHYSPLDDPVPGQFERHDLPYGLELGLPKPFNSYGCLSDGKEYYFLTFRCGKDGHFRGQPSRNDTVTLSDPRTGRSWYVVVNTVGRVRSSATHP